MHHRHRPLRLLLALLAVALGALALSACGGSSDRATTLLQQTFGGKHAVNSGNLSFNLTVVPSGSSTLKGPITLSLGGPFQSLGTGKLPQSNFTIGVSALGRSGSISILSTGAAGYVTLQGTSYQLPQAVFQRLESSFSQSDLVPGSGGSGLVHKLGLHPLRWLQGPQVVGTESVGGTATTHIRSGINMSALLSDFNTFLVRAPSLGVPGSSSFPRGISSATQSRIVDEVKNPQLDVWTGKSDKTLRRLLIRLTLPVTGQMSTALGGLHTAGISLSMQYAGLNQPQTITAPTSLAPYDQFQVKLRAIVQQIQSVLASQLSGGLSQAQSSTTTGSSTSPSGGSSASLQAYSRCVQAAGGDVSKMQQCAPLLNGGG